MLTQAAIFLVETIVGLFSVSLLLRFMLQAVRAPFRNPVSQFVCSLTDFAVLPARRVVPGLWGLDLATLVLAWMAEAATVLAVLALAGAELRSGLASGLAGVGALALVRLVRMAIYVLMVAVVVQVILSWVQGHSPIAPVLNNLTRPFLRPLQKRLPTVGNVDLSSLALVIILQLLLMVPVAWLELSVRRLF